MNAEGEETIGQECVRAATEVLGASCFDSHNFTLEAAVEVEVTPELYRRWLFRRLIAKKQTVTAIPIRTLAVIGSRRKRMSSAWVRSLPGVTLEEVAKGYDEYSRKASGLLSLMQNFSTMFGLQLSKQVFGATETLSNTL
ncbi:hypothetical protein ACOMHN_024850 [Nucella lapillus]